MNAGTKCTAEPDLPLNSGKFGSITEAAAAWQRQRNSLIIWELCGTRLRWVVV